ncbi:HPr family phosphocarrier protein [[Mycoplasma] mobile]|uniref:Phosphocarrier protein Hpr n=1 Tax=Mycoplasma mobile (strain ATCC 43663 / 163K / NCTC 11711) TaxID=267748 RepID=Q6KHN8_MYCM1|nr:HPr family phosphocarrier protein [[Mycoplasma] mobile]AAT27892.1 phosphocarrier protein Hpr [Mycoplasma mobile 163K]
MKKLEAVVIDKIGFHARPASKVVNVASKFHSKIEITKADGTVGNLKSVINIMSLAIRHGEKIKITAEGEDEAAAIKQIEKVLIDEKLI